MIGLPSKIAYILLLTVLSSFNFAASYSRMMRTGTNSRWRNWHSFNLRHCILYDQAILSSKSSKTQSLAFVSTRRRQSFLGRHQRVISRCCIGMSIKSATVDDLCHGEHKDDKVIRSVQESLRKNLVQPHLEYASKIDSDYPTNNEHKKNVQMPVDSTLVLVVACSGGCDSVALLHSVLALTRSEETDYSTPKRYLYLGSGSRSVSNSSVTSENLLRVPCELHVAHFNHEQRGENSDGDEALVRKLCHDGDVTFHCFSWSEISNDDDLGSTSTSAFSQDVARKWRRRRLTELLASLVTLPNSSSSMESTSQRWGAILTAHHRDDAEETILLKLLRGAHLTNLSGMEDKSDKFELDKSRNGYLGYFAKPMLGIRKRNILEYLTKHGLEWREDESNSENKYKRNKVRNQLMPLLYEIAGGEDALQKRLTYLEQQSKDLSLDLSRRAEEYLESMSTDAVFLLPDGAHFLNIVQQEALHIWAARVTKQDLILSYEQMLRIKNQFENYPSRLKWTLDVGDSWSVRRNGKALSVFAAGKNGVNQSTNDLMKHEWVPWEILQYGSNALPNRNQTNTHELCFRKLPHGCDGVSLVIERVKDVSNLTFIPPWRKGRSDVKLREFLRGQKVPLHCRDNAFVLHCSDKSSGHALAVYLENTETWVVHSEFSCDESDVALIKVVLGKQMSTNGHS